MNIVLTSDELVAKSALLAEKWHEGQRFGSGVVKFTNTKNPYFNQAFKKFLLTFIC